MFLEGYFILGQDVDILACILILSITFTQKGLANIIFYSIYYHSTLLLLLRPFFHKDMPITGILPREICLQAANDIIVLTTLYRKSYGLRHTVIHIPQIVFTASTVLLMNFPSVAPHQISSPTLTRSLKDLQELSETWYWCNLTLRHLSAEAEKRGVDLGLHWDMIHPVHMVSRTLHVQNRNMGGGHAFAQEHYFSPNSQNSAQLNSHGGSAWINEEDGVQGFVDSLISFPSAMDDWSCMGPNP